ncbi:hypothetical protein [Solirhodobacter olei]|uniref:hypothetical protein n=1 Tax=Solirhodobacter olei TaxID=2493082 RepID=UPI000FD94A3B|nr:hypothetical protein [Solirhodobacter olei]
MFFYYKVREVGDLGSQEVIRIDQFGNSAVIMVAAWDPFNLHSFHERVSEWAKQNLTENCVRMAAYLDLRGVSVSKLAESDLRRFIMQRSAVADATRDIPIAVHVNNLAAYGVVRMFGILAELSGLRKESSIFPTLSQDEAAAWMAPLVGSDDPEQLGRWLSSNLERSL